MREKLRPMYVMLAGNDTVPNSMWCDGGVRSTEYRLVDVSKIPGNVQIYDRLRVVNNNSNNNNN